MPKATIKFKLPKERKEFEIATKAVSLYSALFEVTHNMIKALRDEYSTEAVAAYLNNLVEDHGLTDLMYNE